MKRSKNFYATLEEASLAAQRLNIMTFQEYKRRYKEDRRLPSNPLRKYKTEWQGWRHFLGRSPLYQTYKEASQAAQLLQIITREEYQLRHKEDPRLPSNPNQKYKDEWVSTRHFLGQEGMSLSSFYSTYEEASQASQKLQIITRKEYELRYKEDQRLPSAPNKKYQVEWQGWPHFLGKE